MENVETIMANIKTLSARAVNLKMNLHDLAEDLPIGWEKIPEVADQAFSAYKLLSEARARLSGARA